MTLILSLCSLVCLDEDIFGAQVLSMSMSFLSISADIREQRNSGQSFCEKFHSTGKFRFFFMPARISEILDSYAHDNSGFQLSDSYDAPRNWSR